MKKVSCNRYQWIGLVVFDLIFIGVFVFIMAAAFTNHKGFDLGSKIVFPILLGILGFSIAIFTNQLFFLPFNIKIYEFEKKLEIKYLLIGSRIILINEIESYSSNIVMTKSSRYDGVMIKLKNGCLIQCGNFNLSDHKPIIQFLKSNMITYSGKGYYRMWEYLKKCLK
jgi:hypothetical protein